MVYPKTQNGLTVCVQPVYWYSQFQNIILFIESWRNQGVTDFIVYFHSSTKEVEMVLDYYQKLGVITIKPWPTFGDLPPTFPEINSQVYRIGHTMASNICILEMKTSIGTIVDFDEIIVSNIGYPDIFSSSKIRLTQVGTGALEFKPTRIQLELKQDMRGFDSNSLKNPTLVNKQGPLIFNTSSVSIINTHSIRKFIKNSDKTVESSEGTLLHYRYNGGEEKDTKKKRNFLLFAKNFDEHLTNMEKVNSIVGEKNDVFDPRIILELNKCIKEITVLENQINSSFPITFYHNAYVDHRYSLPRLRIFSLNKCIKKKNFLLVDLSYEGISDPIRVKLFGESLEGNCPSTYGPARPCFYVAHTFYTDLISTGGMNEVLIHLGSRKVKLRVKEIDRRYEKGITMCVQPVYYYSQWQNIVLYIEAWRAQGATRFIVFYHSSTKETRKVLDYYQSLGIIEYRSWPSFGSLPQSISGEYPKVDDSVFIFSYFLAMNLCILDMKTTIGAVADFDEVLVPRNGTMLDYATKEMTGTNIGALSFGNNYVTMEPSIYTSDFSGVSSPAFIDKGGPSKYIFNASVIDIAQVHWVKSFTDPSKKTKNGDGALLHLRYGASGKKLENSKRSFRFFPNDSSIHIQNMQEMTNRIFNGSDPVFSSNYIDTLNECVKNINKKGNTCRSTGGMCRADMDAINEWVYDKTEGIFLSDSS